MSNYFLYYSNADGGSKSTSGTRNSKKYKTVVDMFFAGFRVAQYSWVVLIMKGSKSKYDTIQYMSNSKTVIERKTYNKNVLKVKYIINKILK